MSDLIARLRSASRWGFTKPHVDEVMPSPEILAEAADRIEELEAEVHRLEAANALLLDKWERQECSWCGTNQALAPSIDDRRELLEALLDIRDPLSRAGVCIFCDQRVGLSVFSNELLNPGRHLKGCAWLARRALGEKGAL